MLRLGLQYPGCRRAGKPGGRWQGSARPVAVQERGLANDGFEGWEREGARVCEVIENKRDRGGLHLECEVVPELERLRGFVQRSAHLEVTVKSST